MIVPFGSSLRGQTSTAVGGAQPAGHIDYVSWNIEGLQTKPNITTFSLISSAAIDLLAGPALAGTVHEVIRLGMLNNCSTAVTTVIFVDDGVTTRVLSRTSLTTTQSLNFERGTGWYVI